MTQDIRDVLNLALEALEDNQHLVADNERHAYVMEYNSIIEKCKETLAQHDSVQAKPEPEQEPVALQDDEIYDAAYSAYCKGENSRELFRIMWSSRLTCCIGWDRDELKSFARNIAALYTTPPQRTWVGLTDDEIAHGWKESWVTEQAWQSAVWWAEDKLKEKNA
jgi:hypothetical protein